ncbi:MAG: insulinase family protein, partial [Acidobacteriaceae bacterium]|nr:insulinase family protein [Acidobacteriaceae bacterium]
MMRRRFSVPLLVFVALLVCAPAFAQTDWKQIPIPKLPEFHPQAPKRFVLPNGMVVLLQEDHELPIIDGVVRIRGGSREEPAAKVGLVDIYGQVWRTGGTEARTGDQLDDFLEARAAKIETSPGGDSAFVSFSSMKPDFADVFKIFVELIQKPAFREDKIPLATNQIDTGIARRNDDSDEIARRVSTQLAYGKDNPYARIPEYATVDAVTRDDLVKWHQTYVHPNNMILGIVGDFDPKQMEATVRQAFSSWPKGPVPPKPNITFSPAKPGLYFVAKEDVNQSEIRSVEPGIERNNPDYFPAQVLNEAFGGGFSSRLFRDLRTEKGLAYSVGGGIGSAYDHPGILRLAIGTKSQTTADAVKGLNEEVDKLLSNPPDQQELQHAKDSILSAFVFNFDTQEKVLREQMTYEYYGYPLDFLERYRAGVEKTSTDDVARVARKYIHKGQFATLVVGNPGEIGNQLTALGPVTPVDITIPPRGGAKEAMAPTGSNAEGKALAAKVVQALGGEAKLQPIKAVRQRVTANRKGPQGEIPLQIDELTVYPDQQWMKMETPMGEMSMVVSPKASFMSMGGQVRDMPSSQRQESLQDEKRDLIYVAQHVNDPKFQFAVSGKEKIGSVEAAILNVNADGSPVKWYVDPQSGRILRVVAERSGEQGPMAQSIDLSDWRDVDGIKLPFKRTININGEPSGSAEVKQVQLNPPVDPKLFEKP